VRVGERLYSDGGIADRPGVAGVAEGARALHHHLTSRSPWRSVGSTSLTPPRRAGLVSVGVEGITRVNPFALERGMCAFGEAEAGLRRALGRAVTGAYVTV